MRSPGGILTGTMPDGQVFHAETFQCKHCQRHTFVKPYERPEDIGGLCRVCMQLMCPECTGKAFKGEPCKPIQQQHEEDITRAIQRRQSRERFTLR